MANQTTPYRGSDGRMYLNIDTSKTLAATDNGLVQNVIADAITITLPATAVGLAFTVRNAGAAASTAVGAGTGVNGSVLVKVSPNASDQIAGNAMTAADNKAIQNTKATSVVGDEVTLIGDGTAGVGWNVERIIGTWAREA